MYWLRIFFPMLFISGPAFLLIYALVAAAVVLVARSRIDAADTGVARNPSAPVEVDRDPYEIAYLRGAGNELLRFTVFDLMRRGALELVDADGKKKTKQIVATPRAQDELSTSLQHEVIAFFGTPHTATELFASGLPATAETLGAALYESRLRQDGMFPGPGVAAARTRARIAGIIVLLLLAAYRIEFARLLHHSFMFLVLEAVIAVGVLLGATQPSRLGTHGRSYLKRLATAVRPRSVAPVAAGFGLLPIAVAATGFGALAGTEYGPLGRIFPRSSSQESSGGCGASSCSSGGDGGGGGGGCGGGCGG